MADIAATIAALGALGERIDGALRQSVSDIAHLIQASAMAHAPIGTVGNSTDPPGNLARSILVDGPTGAAGEYTAQVGPTVIYGRQRELGGHIYPTTAGVLRFEKWGEIYYTHHVYQAPEPYMKPGFDEVEPLFEEVVLTNIAAAIAE